MRPATGYIWGGILRDSQAPAARHIWGSDLLFVSLQGEEGAGADLSLKSNDPTLTGGEQIIASYLEPQTSIYIQQKDAFELYSVIFRTHSSIALLKGKGTPPPVSS